MDAKELQKIIVSNGIRGCWGIRALCYDEDYQAGDIARDSYDWDFVNDISTYGTDTPISLGGSCAIGIDDPEELQSIQRSLDWSDRYCGVCKALLHSAKIEYGNDEGEVIMTDAEVVAVWQ